jgi:hypothetical protein
MTEALLYSGHSLGPVGTVAVLVALIVRLGWMFARRRNRR